MPLICVRGATTCPENSAPAIDRSTCELLKALTEANPALCPSSALAAIVTVTPDLDAAFAAGSLRRSGYTETALLGAVEAVVPGAPERCIRVLMFFETDAGGRPVEAGRGVPVYLHGAARLRPDLAEGQGRRVTRSEGGSVPCSS